MIPTKIYAIENKTWSTTPPNDKQTLSRELFYKASEKPIEKSDSGKLAKQIQKEINLINDGYSTPQEAIKAIQKLI